MCLQGLLDLERRRREQYACFRPVLASPPPEAAISELSLNRRKKLLISGTARSVSGTLVEDSPA
jgi:hypothetical protein